jgi:hypothetical protein
VPEKFGRFLVLVPEGDPRTAAGPPSTSLAAACVTELDALRAPLTEADLQRRRAAKLDPQDEAYLMRWGYPHVLDRFRFHVTLTGPLGPGQDEAVHQLLDRHPPPLPHPFRIAAIAHLVEGEDRRFHLRHRYALSG